MSSVPAVRRLIPSGGASPSQWCRCPGRGESLVWVNWRRAAALAACRTADQTVLGSAVDVADGVCGSAREVFRHVDALISLFHGVVSSAAERPSSFQTPDAL